MELFKLMNYIIAVVFFLCYAYQFAYIPVPFFKNKFKKKTPPTARAETKGRFAVLICARNEEKVVGDLLASIRAQTYDPALYSVFLIADNCTDDTAGVARAAGATVYERQNDELVGKGYALEELLDHLKRDYPGSFDGYFVFDADNLLEPDYIEQMNKTFSDGYEIVTSFRNSKNYGDNWISAGYSLWFLRESRYLNHARYLLGTSCAVSGTGFLFSQRVLDSTEGWHFHMLTEDIEFTVCHVLRGVKIGFCSDAILYDEQPTRFSQSWRQRIRWAKGYLQVFSKYGGQLTRSMLHGSFACYDMTMLIMPAVVLSVLSVIVDVLLTIHGAMHGENLWIAAASVGETVRNMYLTLFAVGAVTTISEWRRIHTSAPKKIFYALTFPLFMFTYVPISLMAMFVKVEWKPIEHGVCGSAVKKLLVRRY